MTEQLDRLLTGKEILEIRKIKKSKHYADIAAGDFPAPLHIGRRSYFLASEVQAWLDRHIAERDERLSKKLENKPHANGGDRG